MTWQPWEIKRGNVNAKVWQAKQLLRRIGYYDGFLDDCFDASFEIAVTKFQKANGLYPNGVWTQATLDQVNQFSDTTKQTNQLTDKQRGNHGA